LNSSIKILTRAVVFLTITFAYAQDEADEPVTNRVTPTAIVLSLPGRAVPTVTKGWPVVLVAHLDRAIDPASLNLSQTTTAGKWTSWSWTRGINQNSDGGMVQCWTLSAAQTTSLESGHYTVTVRGKKGKIFYRAKLDLVVEAAPDPGVAPAKGSEQFANEVAYYNATGDNAKAVESAEKGVALSPDDPLVQYTYGQALLADNRNEAALAAADKAEELWAQQQNDGPALFILKLAAEAHARVLDAKKP